MNPFLEGPHTSKRHNLLLRDVIPGPMRTMNVTFWEVAQSLQRLWRKRTRLARGWGAVEQVSLPMGDGENSNSYYYYNKAAAFCVISPLYDLVYNNN